MALPTTMCLTALLAALVPAFLTGARTSLYADGHVVNGGAQSAKMAELGPNSATANVPPADSNDERKEHRSRRPRIRATIPQTRESASS